MPYVLSWPAGTLTNREFYAGDLALLTNGDPGDYEVVEIEAVTSSTITLAQIPMKPWPVGTRIIPLRQVHLNELPTRSAPTSHVATMSVRFEFDEPERNITPSWGGPDQLFSFPVNWANAPDLGYERTNYTMDTQTGVIEIIDPADVGRVTMRGNVSLFGRARVAAFRAFAAQARGRALRFWCATGTHDLEPLGEIGGAARLDVAPIGYASLFNVPQDARLHFVIVRNDGEPAVYCKITNIEARSGFDRITLESNIPEMTRGHIDRISFLMPVRFDQDSFEIEHVTDNLTAVRTSVTVRSSDADGIGAFPDSPFVPDDPRTIALVRFESVPLVDEIATNQANPSNGLYQLSTISPISGSTYSAWMRTSGGSAVNVQTETDVINNSSVGFVADHVLGIDGVTFEMFARVASGSGNWNVFFQGAVVDVDGNSIDFYFEARQAFGNPETIDAYYYDTENTYSPNDSDTGSNPFAFPRDQWVHVAVVMDGLNFRAYVGGTLVRSAAATSGPALGLTQHSFQYFWMGTNFGSPSPNVYIDSARASSGALYTGSSFTPPTAQLPLVLPA